MEPNPHVGAKESRRLQRRAKAVLIATGALHGLFVLFFIARGLELGITSEQVKAEFSDTPTVFIHPLVLIPLASILAFVIARRDTQVGITVVVRKNAKLLVILGATVLAVIVTAPFLMLHEVGFSIESSWALLWSGVLLGEHALTTFGWLSVAFAIGAFLRYHRADPETAFRATLIGLTVFWWALWATMRLGHLAPAPIVAATAATLFLILLALPFSALLLLIILGVVRIIDAAQNAKIQARAEFTIVERK